MNEIKKLELMRFEKEIARRFEAGDIRGPIHLSGGNEDQLINEFKSFQPGDFVFSTWRNHYHALLAGIPPGLLMERITAGHSMNIEFPEYHFYTSSIVGGILPIAVGVAAGLKRRNATEKVFCFIGDMTSETGIFHECVQYSESMELPIVFVVEDNDMSTDTPTAKAWGKTRQPKCGSRVSRYHYTRIYPHCGIGKYVNF